MPWSTADAYFNQLEKWLDMEGEAERQRLKERVQKQRAGNPERSGETLIRLRVGDHKPGLGGRWLIDFSKTGNQPLPMNRLKVGSPVLISNEDDLSAGGLPGVVSRRTKETLQVAADQFPDGKRFRIDLSPDERTRLRQLQGMARARMLTGSPARLRDTLIGLQEARFHDLPQVEFATRLNPPQQEAVRFALSARDFAIIHGPPGTGKTTTLAEVIEQAVAAGEKVLACAPSNTAVDNLLERLVPRVPSVIRVGHPARVFEALRGHTLDELVEADESQQVIRDMYREADSLMRKASRDARGRDAHRHRREMYSEAKMLRQHARLLERQVVQQVLNSADVVCTTMTIDDDLLGDRRFDLVVIDEACQSTEPALWQAMLRADRVVIAGDHCQLPPTVLSGEAAKEGFQVSPMERLISRPGADTYRRLTVQYRMNEAIMRFPSDRFYDGELIADQSVRRHQLGDLESVTEEAESLPVLEFWDTAGAEWREEYEPDGESKRNPQEATWVVGQVKQLLDAGLEPHQIAVIAPYAAQVRLLRNRLQIPGLEIDTVDGFQGREKEAVLITLVRSNPSGEIGFLADTRRTNVALTRARRALRVIGDSSTLGGSPFYSQLIDYFQEQQAYRTVWELEDIAH